MLSETLHTFLSSFKDTAQLGHNQQTVIMSCIIGFNLLNCYASLIQAKHIYRLGHARSMPTLFHYYFFMSMAPGIQFALHNSLLLMVFTSLTRIASSLPLIYLLLKSHGKPNKFELGLLTGCLLGCVLGIFYSPVIALAYAANSAVICLLSCQKPIEVLRKGKGSVSIKSEAIFVINQFVWTLYGCWTKNTLVILSCAIPFVIGIYTIKLLKENKIETLSLQQA